jgi:1,6-anhydro-N-acetylmuramate kinase
MVGTWQALGLITVTSDGGITAAVASSDGGASADASDRCQDPLAEVKFTVSGSLTSALKKQIEAVAQLAEAGQELKEGMPCVRKNCKNTYDPATPGQKCTFCPGEPVFHEGYKFWSCCDKRKTIDFDAFLAYVILMPSSRTWF